MNGRVAAGSNIKCSRLRGSCRADMSMKQLKKPPGGLVPQEHVPVLVHHDGWKRFMLAHHTLERCIYPRHSRLIERTVGIARRVASGDKKLVALAQRYAEGLRKVQEHVPARRAAPAFYEAGCSTNRTEPAGETSGSSPPVQTISLPPSLT